MYQWDVYGTHTVSMLQMSQAVFLLAYSTMYLLSCTYLVDRCQQSGRKPISFLFVGLFTYRTCLFVYLGTCLPLSLCLVSVWFRNSLQGCFQGDAGIPNQPKPNQTSSYQFQVSNIYSYVRTSNESRLHLMVGATRATLITYPGT